AGGLLSAQRFRVYSALRNHGPCTAIELAERFGIGWRHTISRRLPELRDRGVVRELDTRVCNVGGRPSIVWETTDALPKNPPKQTRSDFLDRQHQDEINYLKARNSELREKNALLEQENRRLRDALRAHGKQLRLI
ncbi:hypothetical protein LCGC14_2887060, partial [marine sediment metagenome]